MKGFTLIEVMICIAIFGIAMLTTFSIIMMFVESSDSSPTPTPSATPVRPSHQQLVEMYLNPLTPAPIPTILPTETPIQHYRTPTPYPFIILEEY